MDLVKATSFGSRLFRKLKFLEETKYFRLKKGTCQGDPISAFLIFFRIRNIIYASKSNFSYEKSWHFLSLLPTQRWRQDFFMKVILKLRMQYINFIFILFFWSKTEFNKMGSGRCRGSNRESVACEVPTSILNLW